MPWRANAKPLARIGAGAVAEHGRVVAALAEFVVSVGHRLAGYNFGFTLSLGKQHGH